MLNADVISMPDKWEYPWYAAWGSGLSRTITCRWLILILPRSSFC